MLCDLIKLEVMDIQLYLAVGKTSQVGSHLLQVAGAMAPLHEVAVHLISSQLHQLITLIAWFHRLQLIEKLKDHRTIVTDRNFLHRIFHWLRFLRYLHGLRHIEWVIHIQLEIAHDGKMIPQLALMVLHAIALWEHTFHDGNDSLSTTLTLPLVLQRNSMIYHVLDFPAILWHHQFLSLGIVI